MTDMIRSDLYLIKRIDIKTSQCGLVYWQIL